MSDAQRRILDMLAAGKITAEEAEKLLGSLGESAASGQIDGQPPLVEPARKCARFMKVQVRDGEDKVDVQIPLELLRAGVKLSKLIPKQAAEHVSAAMAQQGIEIDIGEALPEQLDHLIDQVQDFAVDIKDGNGATVRVFCE